ncbi:hypothetical protein [Pseudoduganella namucuonensis]|uniref:DUF2946 domain-containing protein n=1 Tax=Pseudoduganella namucuonensis TaxID=1035707 RepID=A0A1I7LPZ7_9BURK|nr:hypothetical protein [Pseudoduganella namucuonensis]SFV11714.1 hypothetical protein SAMN05216552_103484 [Pseudoduganella namucuonensis]
MHSSAGAFQIQRFSAPLRRALLCVCALLLALQLVGSAFHEHELSEQLSDCVSCQVAAHALADLPAVNPVLLAVLLAVAYVIARLHRPALVVLRRYLIPVRHGPPAPRLPVH